MKFEGNSYCFVEVYGGKAAIGRANSKVVLKAQLLRGLELRADFEQSRLRERS